MMAKKFSPARLGIRPELYGLPFAVDNFGTMPYRAFGTTGLRVSNLGLGTWKFGYPETGDGSRVDEKMAFKIFDKAMEEGVTFWDTANRYNNASGNSERVIGRWFEKNPGERRNVELATKIYGTMDGLTPNYCRLSRTNIHEATYACLERLKTDHVDLMQFHWYDETTPVEESLQAIEDLIAEDIIRYFGLSNFTIGQLKKYASYGEIFRRARVQSVQNQFDILYGEDPAREGVLDYCAKHKLSFIAWSPLRGGLISERYLNKSRPKKGDRPVDEKRLNKEVRPAVLKKLNQLAELAHGWGLTLTQLAIAYMLQIPGMGPVIAACSTPRQLAENARAGKIKLEKDQCAAVKKIIRISLKQASA